MNFRPLLFTAVGFVAGLLAFRLYGRLELRGAFAYAVPAVFFVCFAGIMILAVKTRSWAAALFVGAFGLAVIRMLFAVPDEVPAGEYTITGTVSAVSERSDYSVVLTGAELDGMKLKDPVRLLIGDRDSEPPKVGDGIRADITLKEDYDGSDELSLYRLSSGVGLAVECKSFKRLNEGGLPLTRWVCFVRKSLSDRIDGLFPENAALASAFLIGDRSELTHDDRELFRNAGIAHILALSGMHVGVLTAALLFVLPKGMGRMRFVSVALFLTFYCAISAFPASLVRASVMSLCILLAELTERRRDPLSSVSLAAIIILLVSPYSLWSVGFRLTFAATLGIIMLVGEGSYGRGFGGRLLSAAGVTIAATMATMVITARRYGYISTYTLSFNLLAVPVFSFVIVMCFAALVMSFPLPFLAELIAWVPDRIMSGAAALLDKASDLPFARLYLGYPPEICGWLMLLIMFIISPYILRPVKKRALIALPVLLLFTLSLVLGIIRS